MSRAVPISVFGIDVVVVVLPVLGAGVVRRVDVDAVHLARMGELQHLQRVVVLGIDDDVRRLVASASHAAHGYEPRIDGLAKFSDHNNVVDRD